MVWHASNISVGRIIESPASKVWRYLTDTTLWPLWGPTVQDVDVPYQTIALGMKGRVNVFNRVWLPFEITQFEAAHYWSWEVGGIAATGHRVIRIDAHRCRLIFEVPCWAAPYALVCLWAITRIRRLVQQN
jgi:hypothetical protein